jgi:epoxyqueuosine reductase
VQATGPFPAEHRVALGDRIYGCDTCQEVCPPNRRAPRAEGAGQVPVLELLTVTDEELLTRHGRWYIPRRDPDFVRRNALVVLGNVGDAGDDHVVDVLRRYLRHPRPMLRAHAIWAARRLGHDELLDAVARDQDPEVRAELARADVPPRVVAE